MHRITLVCSSHRESGSCNAGELLRILQTIGPDTIFEEVHPSNLNSYNKSTLEGRAVTRYRELKSCQRAPVDLYDLPPDLYAVTQMTLDRVAEISDEYLLLTEERDRAAHLK